MFCKRILIAGMLMTGSAPAFAQAAPWSVDPDFKNAEAAVEISGVSCPGLSTRQNWCVAVNDEKKYLQFFQMDGRRITPGKRARVLVRRDRFGQKLKEPDIEGVAHDEGFLYATGSHGAPRRGGELQPSRFLVFRLPVDANTGAPAFNLTRDTVEAGIVSTDRLRAAIAAVPALKVAANGRLDQNGVTIEGLGAKAGQLFFGLRTPVDADGAFILETSAKTLFSEREFALKSHRVDLGAGYGIRAIEPFRDAFLLLAGTGFGDEMPPVVWLWAPGYAAIKVKTLDVPEGWKAEGLMLVSDNETGVRVLTFFDGQKNGAPMEFNLPIR